MKVGAISRERFQIREAVMGASRAELFTQIPGVDVTEMDEGSYRINAPRNALEVLRGLGLLPIDAVLDFSRYEPQAHPIAPARRLFEHQRVAVDRATSRGSLLLGDQMGLGKTTSAACSARALQERGRPTLILAPSYLSAVWRAELDALGFLSDGAGEGSNLFVCKGSKPGDAVGLLGAEWVFCHYDILRHWWSTLKFTRWSSVIFDEAHLVKNAKSQRGRAAHLVTPGTAARFVLTGTPVQNNIAEAHALLELTTGPSTWGSSFNFRKRYAGAYQTDYGLVDSSPTNTDELQLRLDEVYLRRDVSVLEDKLPERTRRKLTVDLTPTVREKVEALLAGYSPREILDAIRRSRLSDKTLEWIMKLRQATSAAKFSATVELVQGLLDQGDSVLIFAWTRAMVEKIAGAVEGMCGTHAVRHVHGGYTQVERDGSVQMWKATTTPAALVATYDTLGTGHTLTKANHVVFHDLDMVPARMLQAEARVYRIGATRPVQSWWMVAEHTLDSFIFNLIQRKAPATAVFGEMGTSDLSDFLGEEDQDALDLIAWSLEKGAL